MRMINFARRNFKELIRDPLSLVFEIALPIFLLFIFQQIKIPGDTYKLENFTPGIIIFGFSFKIVSNSLNFTLGNISAITGVLFLVFLYCLYHDNK